MSRSAVTGVLSLNKPAGETSRAVVNRVVRVLPRRVKVGHAGTLDPLASGVLAVCVGTATRLIESIQRMPKTYRTVIRLGARSDTLDADGNIVETESPQIPRLNEVQEAIATQVGQILQMPPEYSALRIKGRRAYELARTGQDVELAPRLVRIDRVELCDYAWPRLELEIDCGGGTYIRSIARDIGESLGCGGLVEVLVRTRIGPFTLESSVETADFTPETLLAHLRPPLDAVPDLPRLLIDGDQVADVVQGKSLDLGQLDDALTTGKDVALVAPDGELVAIAERDAERGRVQPRKVLI